MTVTVQLEWHEWDGREGERFQYTDMARIRSNIQAMWTGAGMSGSPRLPSEPARDGFLTAADAQAVEDRARDLYERNVGPMDDYEPAWAPGRPFSWRDAERWESRLFDAYKAAQGPGRRYPSGATPQVYYGMLRASAWAQAGTASLANGPSQDVSFPVDVRNIEGLRAFAPSDDPRVWDAVLNMRVASVKISAAARYRFVARGMTPRVNVEVMVVTGGWRMADFNIYTTAWSGDGPWKATVTLDEEAQSAVVGLASSVNSSQQIVQVDEFIRAGIVVSKVEGRTVELTAVLAKPQRTVTVGVLTV